MNKRPDALIYILALAGLIVAGIITTSIINAVKNNQAGTDIRAKAGVVSTLKFVGIVNSVNEDGTLIVDNVMFSPESRSGQPVNYGSWIVTPPQTFVTGSAMPGSKITFTVNTNEFNVAAKQVVAAQITVGK